MLRLSSAALALVIVGVPIIAQEPLLGTWQAQFGRRVHLNLNAELGSRGGYSNYGRTFDSSELRDLVRSGGRITFKLVRAAGTFEFEGKGNEVRGSGGFEFTSSPGYRQQLGAMGFSGLTDERLFVLALADLSAADVRYLDQATSDDLTTQQLVQMVNHGVDLDFVKGIAAAGFKNLSSSELIKTRDHGVTPDYITTMQKRGYRVSLADYTRARDHGVSEDYMTELRGLGFTLDLEQLIAARDHGVSADYIKDMTRLGYSGMTMPEYVRLIDHGVSSEFACELRELGYKQLDADELIRLRNHGVSADFIRTMNRERGRRLEVNELVRLRNHAEN